jgi:hypothetical protein
MLEIEERIYRESQRAWRQFSGVAGEIVWNIVDMVCVDTYR